MVNSTWEWVVFEELNKTRCNLVSFGSCFIVHSVGMGLFLFIGGPTLICGWVNFPIAMAAHPHTNEGMRHIPWYKLLCLSKNQIHGWLNQTKQVKNTKL